jgi:hypothetical protein
MIADKNSPAGDLIQHRGDNPPVDNAGVPLEMARDHDLRRHFIRTHLIERKSQPICILPAANEAVCRIRLFVVNTLFNPNLSVVHHLFILK